MRRKRRAVRGRPRDAAKKAIIGDPRNDENLIVSGLHAAFLFAHNRALDMVRQRGRSRDDGDGFRRLNGCCVALPVADRARVSAAGASASRWSTTSWARPPLLHSAARDHAGRLPGAAPTASATARCGRRIAPTWPGWWADRFSACIFDPSPAWRGRSVPTWSAAPARRDASSAGRASSTLAMVRSRTPSASIRACRRRCFSSRAGPPRQPHPAGGPPATGAAQTSDLVAAVWTGDRRVMRAPVLSASDLDELAGGISWASSTPRRWCTTCSRKPSCGERAAPGPGRRPDRRPRSSWACCN